MGQIEQIIPFEDQWAVSAVRYVPAGGNSLSPDAKILYSYKGRVFQDYEVFSLLEIPDSTGLRGLSPIELHRRTIELSNAAEDFGTKYVANGAVLGGFFEMPPEWKEDQIRQFKKSFEEGYAGKGNVGKHGYIPAGIKFNQLTPNIKDLQFLEQRQYQRTAICGIYNVPPTKIGDYSHGTYSNVEQGELSFLVSTLRPRLVNIEQCVNSQLLTEAERDSLHFEFLLDSVSRADLNARREFYQSSILTGYLTINEIRALENRNPLPGGDILRVPLNTGEAAPAKRELPTPETRELPAPVTEPAPVISYRDAERRDIAEAHAVTVADALARVLRREKVDVLRFAKSSSGQALVEKLKDFYKGDLRHAYELNLSAPLRALAKSTLSEVRKELDKSKLYSDAELDQWVSEFLRELATRYTESRLTETAAIALESEDVDADLESNLDEQQDQVESRAQNATVDTSNGFAVELYGVAGIATLIWVTNPGACGICQAMDGKRMSTGQPFVSKGNDIGTMSFGQDVRYPTLHNGCQCSVHPAI